MEARRIPIQNIYYLLCYAWNQLQQGSLVDVTRLPSTELADLFALVLCDGIRHLARRGLEQGYQVVEDDLAGIRGRVAAAETARRFLLQHGKAHCRFDELSADTPANRILKRTLRNLLRCDALHHDLRKRVRSLLRDLASIGDSEIAADSFRKCQVHSNNRFYRFLLNVCQLIHQASLVDQNPGSLRFRDFERDERRMARVFQDFLFNFMRIHQPDAVVRREQIGWKAHSLTDPGLALLPRMETDVSLRRGEDRLIIDAKYYQKTLTDYYDAPKIHGENLYQLLSYLSNAQTIPGETLSGMLIYPRVDRTLRERYTIQGYTVYISTLDLSVEWRTIERELREIMSVQQLRLQ